MTNPLDLKEWLEEIRMLACRYPNSFPKGSADFALEATELVDDDVSDEYWKLCDDLENLTEKKFPNDEPGKALEWIESELAAHENYADEVKEAVGVVLECLDDFRGALAAFNPPVVPGLEYDL